MEKPHTLKQLHTLFHGKHPPFDKFHTKLIKLNGPTKTPTIYKNNIKGTKLKWTTEHDSAFEKKRNNKNNRK